MNLLARFSFGACNFRFSRKFKTISSRRSSPPLAGRRPPRRKKKLPQLPKPEILCRRARFRQVRGPSNKYIIRLVCVKIFPENFRAKKKKKETTVSFRTLKPLKTEKSPKNSEFCARYRPIQETFCTFLT